MGPRPSIPRPSPPTVRATLIVAGYVALTIVTIIGLTYIAMQLLIV